MEITINILFEDLRKIILDHIDDKLGDYESVNPEGLKLILGGTDVGFPTNNVLDGKRLSVHAVYTGRIG